MLSREGDADLINVRLRSIIDSNANKMIAYPKIGTSVLYILIENKKTEAFIFAVSEVEEVVIKIGDQSFVLNSNETVFNNGLNGMINIVELTKKVNNLITELKNHTHTIPPGQVLIGAQAGVTNTVPIELTKCSDFTSFNKSDYEDTKLKH